MKRTLDEPKVPSYNLIPCDSYAERYTLMYLFELQRAGYVHNIRRAQSYLLFQGASRSWIEQLKTKCRTNTENLMKGCSYTPDFAFDLTVKGLNFPLFRDIDGQHRLFQKGRFYLIHQKGTVHIETKGTTFRGEDDTKEKFSVTKKWLWEKHGVFVNLFCHDQVFPMTFTPVEYTFTDKTRKPRKIKWKIHTLNQYLSHDHRSSKGDQRPHQSKRRAIRRTS